MTAGGVRAGWRTAELSAAVDRLGALGAASVVVRHHGEVVVEQHWHDAGRGFVSDVASVQKSVTALLVGAAAHLGLLRVDETVTSILGPGWSRATAATEARITLRHLLSMTGGLDARLAEVAPPGTAWAYATMPYHVLKPVLEAAAQRPLQELTQEWLTGPVGAADTRWVTREPAHVPASTPDHVRAVLRFNGFRPDPDGRWAQRLPDGTLAAGLETTADDLARIGLLVAAGGVVDGRRVLDADWLAAATTTSQPHNPAYGWLFWVNGVAGVDPVGQPMDVWRPDAPDDVVSATGAGGQVLDVSPSHGLVVALTTSRPRTPGTPAVADVLWSALRDSAPGDAW